MYAICPPLPSSSGAAQIETLGRVTAAAAGVAAVGDAQRAMAAEQRATTALLQVSARGGEQRETIRGTYHDASPLRSASARRVASSPVVRADPHVRPFPRLSSGPPASSAAALRCDSLLMWSRRHTRCCCWQPRLQDHPTLLCVSSCSAAPRLRCEPVRLRGPLSARWQMLRRQLLTLLLSAGPHLRGQTLAAGATRATTGSPRRLQLPKRSVVRGSS